MAISETTAKVLWGRAAGMCSNPNCVEDLTILLEGNRSFNVGEMAHIVASSPEGPRGQVGDGIDKYENLILLCPTCHSMVDKSPEGVYPIELLFKWKSEHERRIRSLGNDQIFDSAAALKFFVARLLDENRAVWQCVGPGSTVAKADPGSNLYEVWVFRKLDTIVPNNTKIVNAVDANLGLLNSAEAAAFFEFKIHAAAFERHQYWRLDRYPTFPRHFEELMATSLDEVPSGDSVGGNGRNAWNVSFSHIAWLSRLLSNHGNVATLSRHDDLVFEIKRKRQRDRLSIFCLNEYTMGLTAVQRAIQELGRPQMIYIGGGWCGYTQQAKDFCLQEQIGLYVTDEIFGALWANEYWTYCKRDKDGDPVYYLSREGA